MAELTFRQKWLSRPLYQWAQKALPAMSETEREAIQAGDTWWDAQLFTGRPDWDQLLQTAPARLTAAEQAFLDGPVQTLCGMLDDWRIHWQDRDLPPEVWRYIREQKFFGMIIPRQYGGLGFSAYAHSEIVRHISSRSGTAAVTVMVPNSLGPGELLMLFGTDEQRERWLPRLADGREIPCFGLTSAQAGSDAAGMTDTGVVCRGEWEGRDVIGLRLNWDKRYITLGPVATVLGVAFKLSDPDGILGGERERGITLALVSADTPGVSTGERHLPAMQVFQNGPIRGRDVFVPLDAIIGGEPMIGQGWRMLMTALSAGRGISLPSLSAAATALTAHTTGAYARVREQFGLPIGKFEGVQEKLGALAANAYVVDAGRRMTCAALDRGHKPSVISAIMKYHATERMRDSVNHAMDVHAGKAVIDGPSNYLGSLYRAVPVGITVEGANILTRNLIVFGQGAIRCHPYLMDEMQTLADTDRTRGLQAFDAIFWRHIGHTAGNTVRAWWHSWTGGLLARAGRAGKARPHLRQLTRYSAVFAVTADVCLGSLGGALKRKEMLSARLGDVLAELYLLSAAVKRWHDEGRQSADLPLLDLTMARGLATLEARLDEVYANLPNRPLAWVLRFLMLPLGRRHTGPPDALVQRCADLLLTASPTRDRLVAGLARGRPGDGLARLEAAFAQVEAVAPLAERLRKAGGLDLETARARGMLDAGEWARMQQAREAVAAVVAVDTFAPGTLEARTTPDPCPAADGPAGAPTSTVSRVAPGSTAAPPGAGDPPVEGGDADAVFPADPWDQKKT